MGPWGPQDVMGAPAWRSHPTWFLVAANDEAIPPDAERQFADRMSDDLWRGVPPPRATASLQAYVSNLRRLPRAGPRAPGPDPGQCAAVNR